MRLLTVFDNAVTHWLTAPEPNAAGRMGLYRIIFGLFALWILAPAVNFQRWFHLPVTEWRPFPTLSLFNIGPPDVSLLQMAAVVAVASLILITIGLKTRPATLFYIIAMLIVYGTFYSYRGKVDHANTFLIAYIPAIMMFSRWDATYSVEAILRKRMNGKAIDPTNDSWIYIWPMRATLLLLSLMYFGAGYIKMFEGIWLDEGHLMKDMLLYHNFHAVVNGRPANPLNPILANIRPLYWALHIAALSFETFFFLSLINRRFRTFFASSAIVFHAFIYFFLSVPSTTMIVIYLMFVDWQALYARWFPFKNRNLQLKPIPTPWLIVLSVGLVIAGILMWSTMNPLASIVSLIGGRTMIFALGGILGIIFAVKSGLAILREDILPLLTQQRDRLTVKQE